MSRKGRTSLIEDLSAPFASLPAPVGLGTAGVLGVVGWGLTWVHGSLTATLIATMGPWFLWLLAIAVAAYSAIGAVQRRLDRRRFDATSDLETLDPYEFERYIAEYYRRQGWVVTNRGGRRADGGVDVTAENRTEKLLIQCKHWKTWKVGARPVRELAGVIRSEGATGAVLVTSGQFTVEARRAASTANIELIDGERLRPMVAQVRRFGAGLRVSAVGARACPKCGAALVLRTAARGPHAGQRFWGCSSFPGCRHLEAVISQRPLAQHEVNPAGSA